MCFSLVIIVIQISCKSLIHIQVSNIKHGRNYKFPSSGRFRVNKKLIPRFLNYFLPLLKDLNYIPDLQYLFASYFLTLGITNSESELLMNFKERRKEL
jgi:hypothetical protein